MKRRESPRFDRNDPNQLLAYLRYALDEVRSTSERSGQYLDLAITMLAEDTNGGNASDLATDVRQG